MKKLNILISLICILCMSTVALGASLDSYEVDDINVTLTAEGTPEGVSYGDPITVEILDKGASVLDDDSEYTKDKLLDDYVYITQIPADAKGAYKITVDMEDKESGFYTMRVNGKETEMRVFFATLDDKLDVLDELFIICEGTKEEAVSDIAELLDSTNPESTVVNMFNVIDAYTTKVNGTVLAEILYTSVKADDSLLNSADSFKKALLESVHVAALDGGMGNIADYASELGLDSEYMAVYNTQLKDSVKTSFVADYLKGKKAYTSNAVSDAFEEGVILSFTKSFDANTDVKLLIDKFGKDISVKDTKYEELKTQNKTKLYEYIIEKSPYSSTAALAKAINDKTEALLDDQTSSSGGGGGGGGGGSSFGGSGMSGGLTGYAPLVAGGKDDSDVFSDMANHAWAKEAVEDLNKLGVVSGVGGDMFAPSRKITREELLAMLLRAYGINPDGATTDKFTDVESGSWYAPYVAKGLELGVTSGISEKEFGTGKYITRQEAAAMANRIAEAFGVSLTRGEETFADDANIAPWAKDAVYKLKNAKVINGVGDGTFAPLSTCTRAEAAVIINALINI